MNIGVQIPVQVPASIIWGIYPEVEFLDHIVILFLFFLRKLHTVFHSGPAILLSTKSAEAFQFLHSLINTCYFTLEIINFKYEEEIKLY